MISVTTAPQVQAEVAPRERRRQLRRQDTRSRHLGELHAIRSLLERATDIVATEWVHDAWFNVATTTGPRAVTAYDIGLVQHNAVTGACLVGSIVHAAGGPATVRTQLVQRTLDLTWHTLREDPERPVRWCPGPGARRMQVRDLTHWNDFPGRTQSEVIDLMSAARHATIRQAEQYLVRQ